MNCDTIVHHHRARWTDTETPFLLWEIGPHTVLEHWVNLLFNMKGTLHLWLEEPDVRLIRFISESFPLCERSQVHLGAPPTGQVETTTFIDEMGGIMIRHDEPPRRYLAAQEPSATWFAMVRRWLHELQARGTQTPQLEKEVQPGVFIAHHARVSPRAEFFPPCWVGPGSRVGAATIGPDAVVGENCIIGAGSRIRESCVLANTCVGTGLDLEGMVAGARRILQHGSGERIDAAGTGLLNKIAS